MERLSIKVPLTDKDVPAILLLSDSMRTRLFSEIFGPYLLYHPMFRLWANMSERSFHVLCYEGAQWNFLSPSDDLFQPGIEARDVFRVEVGTLMYTQTPSTSLVESKE